MIVRSFLTILRALLAIYWGLISSSVHSAVGAREIIAVADEFLARHSVAVQQRYGPSVRIETATDRIDSRLSMSSCDTPLATELKSHREIGRINIQVRCDGSNPWTLYVPAEVNVYQPVVVTANPIGRHTILSAGDLVLREIEISQLNGGFYTAIEDVTGMVAKRMLSTGKPLTSALLEPPVVVRRGDAVIVTAVSNGLQVKMPGEALADGQTGQQISVRNTQSSRIVEAEVTGPGQVQVTM